MTKDELINEPADATAPEWARWKAQDSDGEWYWFIAKPRIIETIWFSAARYCLACKGQIIVNHDWRKTLKEVNVNRELNPNTSSVTDSQARAMAVESGTCSDGTQCGTFAETAYCDDCPNRPPLQYDPDDVAFTSDPTNPSHYRAGKVECIDALESATVNKRGLEAVCAANVIKYLWRYESKGGLEDVRKARWYLERLEQHLSD